MVPGCYFTGLLTFSVLPTTYFDTEILYHNELNRKPLQGKNKLKYVLEMNIYVWEMRNANIFVAKCWRRWEHRTEMDLRAV
jgi:hypothetical protein